MTLLAVDLKAPQVEGPLTAHALAIALGARLAGIFRVSHQFFTVLIMWVHHHTSFRMVRNADVRLLFSNGFFLMIVTAVPFPTAVVAQYLTTPAAPAAVVCYSGFFFWSRSCRRGSIRGRRWACARRCGCLGRSRRWSADADSRD